MMEFTYFAPVTTATLPSKVGILSGVQFFPIGSYSLQDNCKGMLGESCRLSYSLNRNKVFVFTNYRKRLTAICLEDGYIYE